MEDISTTRKRLEKDAQRGGTPSWKSRNTGPPKPDRSPQLPPEENARDSLELPGGRKQKGEMGECGALPRKAGGLSWRC